MTQRTLTTTAPSIHDMVLFLERTIASRPTRKTAILPQHFHGSQLSDSIAHELADLGYSAISVPGTLYPDYRVLVYLHD